MEEKIRFFAGLNQALRPLADPEEIMAAAARMLGEHLGVDRCAYAEVEANEKYLYIMSDYTRGKIPSVVGRFSVDDLGPEALRLMRANRPYVVNDVEAEPPPGRDLSAYRQAEVRALMCAPLIKNGHYVAKMAVSQKTPRHWEPWEIELVAKVADRCWEAVERARAVRNLRESEERYRAFIANNSEAIWRFELEQPIPINLPEVENEAVIRGWGIHRDITERKEAEEERRGSEERSRQQAEAERERLLKEIEAERNRLRRILEQMPIGVMIAEAPSGRMIFQNYEAESLLRRPIPPSDDYQGYARYGALRADGSPYRPEEYPIARALIAGEVIKGEEVRFPRGDGTETFFSVDSAPINDSEGRRVLAVATFIDITEHKRAEEALSESEEHFAKAFRISPVGLLISRLSDGLILEVNDKFVSVSGYDRDEVIGKSSIDLGLYADPTDRQRMLTILEEQNYVRDYEFGMRVKSGETRLISLSAEPLDLRGEHCWLTVAIDITERKQAEEALRMSEEQARRQLAQVEAIYATAPVGLCVLDTDLRFLSINEHLAEMDGKSVKEHLGRTVRELIPEMADTVEPDLRRVIGTGEPALKFEHTGTTAREPGVLRHFICSYYPIKNGGGRVLGVNVVVMEITQRKKIEEELERLFRQEKAAREEAEAASRMKDEFLTTVSHELRTPLTSILGWARMLTGGRLNGPQARHALEVIEQSAQAQTRLVEDVLDTSRIITGRLRLDAQPVAIEHIFHAAVDVIRPSAVAKGISLSEVTAESDGVVLGDAKRLQQAVWNLLSNAVKFTNEGGRVEARLGPAEGQIEIAVEDNGIGIEPGFLPHVFDRFRQADSTSTRTYGGLGIGLAIVRHVVEMHGGSVSASSPGKSQGATFKIRLPLISAARMTQLEVTRVEAPPTPPIEREVSENGLRLDGVRVMLVEDDPVTLDLLKFIFDESGAEVITAASVDEALGALERFRPDALVSDIAMPDRDGCDLIREVRTREPERGGNIPAVAVTAYARSEDRVRALEAGFQMHVTKPIVPEELIAVVASLTGHIHYGLIGVSGISASNGN